MRQRTLLSAPIPCLATLIAAMMIAGTSCANAPKAAEHAEATPVASHGKGHLVIVGGALDSKNAAVYNRFLQDAGPGAKIGVLPTASGVADAGFDIAKDMDSYSKPGTAEVIEVREATSAAANTEPIAAQIRSKHGIYFAGGDQRRIVNAFRPESGDTVGYAALQDVLKNGGVIAGSSAGAAMMSDPIIGGGTSANALLNGVTKRDKEPKQMAEDEEPRGILIDKGMGFFPYGLSDQHFLARGRLGRTIVALEATKLKRGYGIDENSAIDVNLATGMIETIGNERTLLLTDMTDFKHEGASRTGIRLSMLGGGDKVDGNTGVITIVPARKPLDMSSRTSAPIAAPDAIWENRALPTLIEKLALNTADSAVGYDANFEFRFTKDDKTKEYIGPNSDPKTLSITNLRLDITPKAKPAK